MPSWFSYKITSTRGYLEKLVILENLSKIEGKIFSSSRNLNGGCEGNEVLDSKH
jgi:hypothetical protein